MAKVVSTTETRTCFGGRPRSLPGIGALPFPALPQHKSGVPALRRISRVPGRSGTRGGGSKPSVWRGSTPGSRCRRASTARQFALIALRALHPILDPVVGRDAGRRVHALGGKTHDVDDFGLALLLVEAVGP